MSMAHSELLPASVPFVMTRAIKSALRAYGYTDETDRSAHAPQEGLSAIIWLGWHHCPRWQSTGAAAVPQLHFHAVGWPTAQPGITRLAWATPMDMAIARSTTEQVFSMSRPPCAAKTLLYRAAKFLGNRSSCGTLAATGSLGRFGTLDRLG
jgi:hypothetical protein